METPNFVTSAKAAELLDISVGRIRQLISLEILKSDKVGNMRFISLESIDAYKTNKPKPGWPKGKKRKISE